MSGQALKATDPVGLDCGPDYCGPAAASSASGRDSSDTSTTWAFEPPPVQQFLSATAQPEKAALKETFKGALKAGAVSGTAAGVGYSFGGAASNVPIAGAPASWLVSYMVDQFGSDEMKFGFGAGMAASSIQATATGATQVHGGAELMATEVGAIPGGLAIAQGIATVANGAANAGAGIWLMAQAKRGPKPGGATDQLNRQVADGMEDEGMRVTHGGGRGKEEYFPGPGGGRTGSNRADITAVEKADPKLPKQRVQTVDTYKNGLPTKRELKNAGSIIKRNRQDGMTLIPKKPKGR